MTNTPSYSGIPMIEIDGAKVRSIRESKGLTQLYLATAVGVTTDTISRWENKRYPTIKRENALKLAEALEAPLDDILEDKQESEEKKEPVLVREEIPPPPAGPAAEDQPPEKIPAKKFPSLFFILSIVTLFGIASLLWLNTKNHQPLSVSAIRVLPPHTPPGTPFPVAIHVATESTESLSLILKETLPYGCVPIAGSPPFTTLDRKTNELKWIRKSNSKKISFFYMARFTPPDNVNTDLVFDGSVTMKKGFASTSALRGDHIIQVSYYHWADNNSDGFIDDEEILTVYDRFSAVEDLDIDISRIEDMWAGNGYQWDAEKVDFVIKP
ncbi:MAG: helix-turn-helix domain-containing protein [Desulfobulbaceae bacterium]|nr:helix-turn-helix domain-containing protein [Desulfobulbaceae bacterium]